jgi:hypothetical protein
MLIPLGFWAATKSGQRKKAMQAVMRAVLDGQDRPNLRQNR